MGKAGIPVYKKQVTNYLDEITSKFPDKTALIDGKGELTFSELKTGAKRIASFLAIRKLYKQPVAVFLPKCKECIMTFMGIAYSGNFYTPIDTSMPVTRIAKILETLKPSVIITDTVHKEEALALPGGAVLTLEEMLATSINETLLTEASNHIIDTDVLYVFFTSGSTGTPKGVTISHRAVIDYTEWVTETFQIDERHIFGNQAPLYFDNTVLDIYQMLKTGATLCLIPENLFVFPPLLLDYLKEKKINTIFWVPSALSFVANVGILADKPVPSLQKVLFCGEVMPNKQLNMWRRAYPDVLFANLYGPTEITDVCAYYIVDRPFADNEPLPIGFPCRNTDILVLDENNQLVEGDAIGELCVRGSSLSYGYYCQPEKTEAVFVQNPLNSAYPEKIYRTGDLVRYNDRGELIYVSRKDFQIKHMGYRIELGEIETAVSALDGITMNCCLYDTERNMITLFYTGTASDKEILAYLKNQLPVYMLPGRLLHLDNMPLNLNGKIDRTFLKGQL